jgi:hypothetical protein
VAVTEFMLVVSVFPTSLERFDDDEARFDRPVEGDCMEFEK